MNIISFTTWRDILLETNQTQCPYCGETIEIVIDTSVADQEYVEDCSVCCRPILFSIHYEEGYELSVEARRENE